MDRLQKTNKLSKNKQTNKQTKKNNNNNNKFWDAEIDISSEI